MATIEEAQEHLNNGGFAVGEGLIWHPGETVDPSWRGADFVLLVEGKASPKPKTPQPFDLHFYVGRNGECMMSTTLPSGRKSRAVRADKHFFEACLNISQTLEGI